jgi:hypothetical protein
VIWVEPVIFGGGKLGRTRYARITATSNAATERAIGLARERGWAGIEVVVAAAVAIVVYANVAAVRPESISRRRRFRSTPMSPGAIPSSRSRRRMTGRLR